jgi:hypothetical protein
MEIKVEQKSDNPLNDILDAILNLDEESFENVKATCDGWNYEELKIKYEIVKDEFANDLTQNHMNILPVVHYKEQSWYKKLFYTIKNLFKKNDK